MTTKEADSIKLVRWALGNDTAIEYRRLVLASAWLSKRRGNSKVGDLTTLRTYYNNTRGMLKTRVFWARMQAIVNHRISELTKRALFARDGYTA